MSQRNSGFGLPEGIALGGVLIGGMAIIAVLNSSPARPEDSGQMGSSLTTGMMLSVVGVVLALAIGYVLLQEL